MGKMNELNAQGVTDLHSYSVGYEDATERIIKLIKDKFADTNLRAEIIAVIKEEK